MKIYLDNCCFNRPYDDQDSLPIRIETEVKLEIQNQIREGTIELVWSYILVYENSQNPHEERREEISKWQNIAKNNVFVSEPLLVRMRQFEKQGFKPTDALHISCAIEAKCNYFITVDKGILKKRDVIQELKIRNPIEFIEEQEES
jgi:predicted nucleic acid-binding protein